MKSAMMRKLTIFAIVSLFCTISYAQRPGLKGLSVGLGIPIEFTDLEAAGLGFMLVSTVHTPYQTASPWAFISAVAVVFWPLSTRITNTTVSIII